MTGLTVLAVDDEQPALDELCFLLRRDERVAVVLRADSGVTALRYLRETAVDAVFLDIQMPGLDGLEMATLLPHFKQSPQVVFVTAHSEHAAGAFELNAVDYLLKPIREERLREALRRISEGAGSNQREETIPVELGGVTRFVRRADVLFVEAHGDYSRLHTVEGSHLVRIPIGALEERWQSAGFLRIHRSHLISLQFVDEVRTEEGRCRVRIGETELSVSRRSMPVLRDLLRQHRAGT